MRTLGQQRIEFLPQIHVLHRLPRGGFPTLGFPALHPFGNAFANVFAVHVDTDTAGPLEGLERLNDGCKLHAVVGGQGLATTEFFGGSARLQENSPSTRAGVAFASTIGVNNDVIQEDVSR